MQHIHFDTLQLEQYSLYFEDDILVIYSTGHA